jgi:hypothetical protein
MVVGGFQWWWWPLKQNLIFRRAMATATTNLLFGNASSAGVPGKR